MWVVVVLVATAPGGEASCGVHPHRSFLEFGRRSPAPLTRVRVAFVSRRNRPRRCADRDGAGVLVGLSSQNAPRRRSMMIDDDPSSSNNQSGQIGIEIESVTRVSVRNVWLKKLN
jgi:hypothetical protein